VHQGVQEGAEHALAVRIGVERVGCHVALLACGGLQVERGGGKPQRGLVGWVLLETAPGLPEHMHLPELEQAHITPFMRCLFSSPANEAHFTHATSGRATEQGLHCTTHHPPMLLAGPTSHRSPAGRAAGRPTPHTAPCPHSLSSSL